jgi:glucans biosynthesis protein
MGLVLIVVAAWLAGAAAATAQEPPFGLEQVIEKARVMAREPFKDPAGSVPKFLLDLEYDQWRDIRFRPAKSVWRSEDLPFEIQFFHVGLYYDRSVKINVVDNGQAQPLPYSTEYFDYGKNQFSEPFPSDLGFAGFRVHYPIKSPCYKDEAAVFVGASYYRSLGKDHVYGLSARGLALDTAAPTGEEFPYFREFWIEKPKPGATSLTVYGLLDSPGVTGAYKYVIHPGRETTMKVESAVFRRRDGQKVGVAPLTSMFLYGENANVHMNNDFRPEIHDSDGLLVHYKYGEWLWRPLVTPQRLLVNSFFTREKDLVGFGLLQRDISYDNYQDLEAWYEKRPSVWITPDGDWGEGHVELVLIPTTKEIHDNVVAYWVPHQLPPMDQPMVFNYTMRWHTAGPIGPLGGRVTATRTAKGKKDNYIKMVVDFEGGELGDIETTEGLEAEIGVGANATLVEHQLAKNPYTGGWRLVFQIQPEAGALNLVHKDLIELRAFLRYKGAVVTETWSYGVQP